MIEVQSCSDVIVMIWHQATGTRSLLTVLAVSVLHGARCTIIEGSASRFASTLMFKSYVHIRWRRLAGVRDRREESRLKYKAWQC